MSKKTYGRIAIVIDIFTIFMEVLIIARILPYNITCGGRLESYEAVVPLALTSIVIQLILALTIAISSDMLHINKAKKVTDWILRIFTVYFCVNIIMNLMGVTWFERIIASLLCIIQILCFVKILKKEKNELRG